MTDEPTTERVAVRWRVPAGVAMVVAGIGVAAVIVGMSSGGAAARSTTAAAPAAQFMNAPSASPGASPAAGEDRNGWAAPGTPDGDRQGMMGGRMGGRGMSGEISITGISGSQISLATADGWTRTIDATGATIEKGGKTATVADLAVGDQIDLRQTRGTDGKYTITAIAVVQPQIVGSVTAVDGSSITIKQFDGTAKTVVVTASTTYASGRRTADKAAVVVGSLVMARGTLAADGTFTATAVEVMPADGPNGGPGRMHGGNGQDKDGNGPNGPAASPSPAAGDGGA
ncbi:MAG: DUF5666 domain-containing protein [Chloroflexota bacterium]